MLNKAERLEILENFRNLCFLGQLPAHVDLAGRRVVAPSTRKKCFALLSFSFFVLNTLYKNGSLAHAYVFVPNIQLHQLLIHVILAMGTGMITFWYFSLYVWDPELFFKYFSIAVQGNNGGPVDPMDNVTEDWRRRMRGYSLQDLIARGLPYLCAVGTIAISSSFVYDSSMRLLLYNALPSSFQNWGTFGLCLLEYVRAVVMLVAVATPIWQLQVVLSGSVCNQLRLIISAMEIGGQSVRRAYRELRCLQLYIVMLNKVNSYLIFTWKLLSISVGIMSGYAAVAHFREYPVFGIMYYVLLFDVVLVYTLIYEKAFKVPELFGQVASCANLQIRGEARGVLRRQIRSIPPIGVKVGDFHLMERASTLIFMNFVVVNIVNMLVAYG